MINFVGKTAIVTGGTRGIGKSIVDLLSALGCKVIYTGTKKKVLNNKKRIYHQLDFLDSVSLNGFLAELHKLPKIDILINNAGINIIEPIYNINIDSWQKLLKVNLTGAMVIMREVSQKMKKNKGGKILNISSIFGVISKSNRAAYSATKSGLIGLTRAAALDLADYNILINALCPGFTLTDLTKSILPKEEIRALASEVPLGRFADIPEVAKVAVFLCSDLNSYMTGQTLIVDGGYSIK